MIPHMNLARLAAVAAALALGALEWAVSPKDTPAILLTDIAAGWAFCAGGLINIGGTRARRMALLFEVVGISWLFGALVPSLLDVYRGPLVHLLIAYPTGRVGGRLQRAVVVGGISERGLRAAPRRWNNRTAAPDDRGDPGDENGHARLRSRGARSRRRRPLQPWRSRRSRSC